MVCANVQLVDMLMLNLIACSRTPYSAPEDTVSPYNPPYCTGGTGDEYPELCEFTCKYGLCPIEYCSCTATGNLDMGPSVNATGTAIVDNADFRLIQLCADAYARGYTGGYPCGPVSSDSGGGGNGDEVSVPPSIWSTTDPQAVCLPPCTLILPPYPLGSTTTLNWPPLVTIIASSEGGSIATVTTTISIPPITTTEIEVWPVTVYSNNTDPIVFRPIPSITPPAVPITFPAGQGTFPPAQETPGASPVGNISFGSSSQTVYIQPQPTIFFNITPTPTSSITYSSATPKSTCTAHCGHNACRAFGCDHKCGLFGCDGGCGIWGCGNGCGLFGCGFDCTSQGCKPCSLKDCGGLGCKDGSCGDGSTGGDGTGDGTGEDGNGKTKSQESTSTSTSSSSTSTDFACEPTSCGSACDADRRKRSYFAPGLPKVEHLRAEDFVFDVANRTLFTRDVPVPANGQADWSDFYGALLDEATGDNPTTIVLNNYANTVGATSVVTWVWGDTPKNIVVKDLSGCYVFVAINHRGMFERMIKGRRCIPLEYLCTRVDCIQEALTLTQL